MIQFLFALLAGIVTVGGPCIFPLLPIILGTSTVKRHPLRPVAIVLGFTLAFTGFAILFSLFGSVLGLSPDAWRYLASAIIALFGVMLLFPKFQAAVFAKLEPLLARVMPKSNPNEGGLASGFLLGLTLGAVWTPCAGPVLGSILTLVAAGQNLGQAAILLSAFALGAGIPMLLIAYGGQYAIARVRSLSKYTATLQKIFGIIIILAAIGFVTHLDTILLAKFPTSPLVDFVSPPEDMIPPLSGSLAGTSSTLPVLASAMPEFQGISKWWNTADGKPLTPESLKGKVVLVDFWTYSCINCIRTQPVLKAWWKAYKDDGLVIVGVHTPEFAFEKVPENVEAAFKKAGLEYPIALDDQYATWTAYRNHYWPAGYLFDRQGRLRAVHYGEGNYEETEKSIRSLLMESGPLYEQMTGADSTPTLDLGQTPETYFGLARQERFSNTDAMRDNMAYNYTIFEPKTNEWSIGGSWLLMSERAESLKAENVFRMNFESNAFYLVLGSEAGPRRMKVLVDGHTPTTEQGPATITVSDKQLYKIVHFPTPGRHTVELQMVDAGIQFYAATFGE